MATQKPLSTISYNTEPFLLNVLNDLYNKHIIQCWMYIKHKGEDGDKDHIHLRIEPNRRIDAMEIAERFLEFVPDNEKPLCCRPFRPSKEEDWFLYVVHEPRYLKLKYTDGDKYEKLPYEFTDIVASEHYDVEVAFIRAKAYLEHTSSSIAKKIRTGSSPISLIEEGEDVFTVNAIMKSLKEYDYNRVVKRLVDAEAEVVRLKRILNSNGIDF